MNARVQWLSCCLAATVFTFSAVAADSTPPAGATTASAPKSFQIRNHKYGNLLRPEEANGADGTPIVLYPSQPWKCLTWKLYPAGESRFQLQNHFTSKTFAAAPTGRGAGQVTQVPFVKKAEDRPVWQFSKLPDGAYKISDAKSGKALTAIKDSKGSGVKVFVQDWEGSDSQKWELIEIDPKQLTM